MAKKVFSGPRNGGRRGGESAWKLHRDGGERADMVASRRRDDERYARFLVEDGAVDAPLSLARAATLVDERRFDDDGEDGIEVADAHSHFGSASLSVSERRFLYEGPSVHFSVRDGEILAAHCG